MVSFLRIFGSVTAGIRAGSASAACSCAAACGPGAVEVGPGAAVTVIVVDVALSGRVIVIVAPLPPGLDPPATVAAAATPQAVRRTAENASVIPRRIAQR